MGEIKSYKDLLIWQKGIKIVTMVYHLTNSFPKEELFALTNQLKRAAVSIPSNISEGFGRNTDKSFSHFLDISRGSLYELETQLIIARHKNYINDNTHQTIEYKLEEFQRMAMAFQNGLQ